MRNDYVYMCIYDIQMSMPKGEELTLLECSSIVCPLPKDTSSRKRLPVIDLSSLEPCSLFAVVRGLSSYPDLKPKPVNRHLDPCVY